jgi:hypothetical protein
MGILARLLGRTMEREQGVLADPDAGEEETPRFQRPPPTPTGRPIKRPEPTPTTRPFADPGTTAGTRSYGSQGGTPSTQRIHNSPRQGH